MTSARSTIESPAGDPQLWRAYLDCRYRNLYEPFGLPRTVNTSALDEPPLRPDVLHRAAMLKGAVAAVARLDLQLKHPSGPCAQLRYFAVDTPYRGTGVGQELLVHLETEARKAGCKRLWMEARTAAASFYARAGYRATGEGPLKFDVIPHLIMEKTL